MSKNRIIDITLPDSEDWISRVKKNAYFYEETYGNCSQAILKAFMDEFKIDNPLLMRSAGGMFGGMISSLTCGVISAAVIVLGMLIGREKPEQGQDALFPVIQPTQELVKRIKEKLGAYTCGELTGVDFFDLKAIARFSVSEDHKLCCERTAIGAEETAKLLLEMQKNGELFRISP